jgi:hypothetical protein
MKLPWYIKNKGMYCESGKIYVKIQISKIYIVYLYIFTIFNIVLKRLAWK